MGDVTILVLIEPGNPTGSETRVHEEVVSLPGDTPIRDLLQHVRRGGYGWAQDVHIPFQAGCPDWEEEPNR